MQEQWQILQRSLRRTPLLSIAVVSLCVSVWYRLGAQAGPVELVMPQFWLFSAEQIWDGAYWGLLASPFVEGSLAILFLNLVAFWLLSTRVERLMGRQALLALLLFSALITSASQLLMVERIAYVFPALGLGTGGPTGMGLSAVICALLGFMVSMRWQVSAFYFFLPEAYLRWLISWVIVMVLLSLTGLLPVHNVAHLTGIVFGWAFGQAVMGRRWRPLAFMTLAVMAGIVVMSCFWMPWSPRFEYWKLGPGNVTEKYALIQADAAAGLEAEDPYMLNKMAWLLATSEHPEIRAPERALTLARKACRLTEWNDPLILDTFAASYAAQGNWDGALKIQRQALRVFDRFYRQHPNMETHRRTLESNLESFEQHKALHRSIDTEPWFQ